MTNLSMAHSIGDCELRMVNNRPRGSSEYLVDPSSKGHPLQVNVASLNYRESDPLGGTVS
jgi:hypothetical protein